MGRLYGCMYVCMYASLRYHLLKKLIYYMPSYLLKWRFRIDCSTDFWPLCSNRCDVSDLEEYVLFPEEDL
jgi:hypothetical protein